jgi:hypothetical protein
MTAHEDSAERDIEDLELRSKRLTEEISDVREDWERKRSDPGVPGAAAPEDTPADAEDERAPWQDE